MVTFPQQGATTVPAPRIGMGIRHLAEDSLRPVELHRAAGERDLAAPDPTARRPTLDAVTHTLLRTHARLQRILPLHQSEALHHAAKQLLCVRIQAMHAMPCSRVLLDDPTPGLSINCQRQPRPKQS